MRYFLFGILIAILLGGCSKISVEEPTTTQDYEPVTPRRTVGPKLPEEGIEPLDYIQSLAEEETERAKQFVEKYYETERTYLTVQRVRLCEEKETYHNLFALTDGAMTPGCAVIFEVKGIRDGMEELRHIYLIRTSDSDPWEVKDEGL